MGATRRVLDLVNPGNWEEVKAKDLKDWISEANLRNKFETLSQMCFIEAGCNFCVILKTMLIMVLKTFVRCYLNGFEMLEHRFVSSAQSQHNRECNSNHVCTCSI